MNYVEFNDYFIAQKILEPKKLKIKLLTYNLFLRPPGIKTNESDYKNERLDYFIKMILPQFDIICLQEVFGTFSSRKEKLIKSALKAGYYVESSPDPSFFSSYLIDGGLVILSRYPIVTFIYHDFKHGDFPDSLTNRGVLYVNIKIGKENLHLFTTHTQATYVGSERWIINQTSQFIDKTLEKHRKNNEVVLFIGDLNINAREPFYPGHYVFGSKIEVIHEENNQYNEYLTLLNLLSSSKKYKIQDLIQLKYGESPPTYGESYFTNNEELPCEVILTHPVDQKSNHSIDYFISLEKEGEEENLKNTLFVDKESVKIEKFLVNEFRFRFTQLSDHYGVSAELAIKVNDNE